VPGTLLEVSAEHPREALAAARRAPQATAAHLYGDTVRVLWTPGAELEGLSRFLAGEGVPATVRPIPVDMETAFAFLAEVDQSTGARP
jgi:hypothetical protein